MHVCHIHFVLLLHLKNGDGKQPKARSKNVKSAMNIVPLYCSSWTGRLGECPLWPCYCCSLDWRLWRAGTSESQDVIDYQVCLVLPCDGFVLCWILAWRKKSCCITIKSSTFQNANLPSSAKDRPETKPCHVAWAGADSTSCLRGRVFLRQDLSQSTTIPSQLT